MSFILRKSTLSDLAALCEIYNYEVKNGTATLDLEEKSLEDRKDWILSHNRSNHPLLVATNEQDQAIAYVSLSPFIAKDAFAATVELSLYVHPAYRRKGIARQLMNRIIQEAKANVKTEMIISVITDENVESIAFHESLGFCFMGALPNVARKFGKSLGIVYYQLPV